MRYIYNLAFSIIAFILCQSLKKKIFNLKNVLAQLVESRSKNTIVVNSFNRLGVQNQKNHIEEVVE